jgi:hypothetical protein
MHDFRFFEKKVRFSSLLWPPPFLSLFLFIWKETIILLSYKIIISYVDNLHLSISITFFLKKKRNSLAYNLQALTLDLEELNCRNKNLDVGLDALRSTLDLFLHKTSLLVEFICHLRKIIYLSYKFLFF